MIIQAFPSGPFETNAYIAACPKTKHAVVIDPAPDSFASLVEYIHKHSFLPQAVWLTHSHWDHTANVAAIKEKYEVPVFVHLLDAPNLEKPGSDRLPCWMAIKGVVPSGFLQEGDRLSLGELIFEVIHTPGHTPGGVCFYCSQDQVLISGDTLFKGSIGNLSFPTASPEQMWPSLDKLAKLPPKTRVFPGHGPSTTIEDESWLPYARQKFDQSL